MAILPDRCGDLRLSALIRGQALLMGFIAYAVSDYGQMNQEGQRVAEFYPHLQFLDARRSG